MNKKEQTSHDKYCEDDYESPFEDSIGSSLSSFSSDLHLMEDEISSSSLSSSSSTSSSYGPLYELSELMAQLPIKRGLSKYYQGKSQTFTSLSSVKSLEDLAKRGRPSKRKIKSCESHGRDLDNHIFSPKAIISKKKNYRISLRSSSKISRVIAVNEQFWDLV